MSAHHSTFKYAWLAWTALGFFVFALVAYIAAQNVIGYQDYDAKRAEQRYANLAKLQADDQKTLTSFSWIDKDKKIVSIPLEEALPEEITTLQAKPLQQAGVIPGSVPTPMPPVAPAPTAVTNAALAPAPAAATTTAPVTPKT